MQITRKGYLVREGKEERDWREITSYIDYLYVTSLLCNPVLRRMGSTKLVTTLSKAGIIEKFIFFSPKSPCSSFYGRISNILTYAYILYLKRDMCTPQVLGI